jgi:N-acyl homoserine lactone hydrolase
VIEIVPLHQAGLELPPQHPEGPGVCDVFAFLVRDGDAAFLVDTGVGEGSAVIDALYKPRRSQLLEALAAQGVAPGGLAGIACSHLHFDHCGNNRLFPGLPIFVQRAEVEAARAAHYTVPDWVDFEGSNYQVVEGRRRLSPS